MVLILGKTIEGLGRLVSNKDGARTKDQGGGSSVTEA